jgi:hypothetical protein
MHNEALDKEEKMNGNEVLAWNGMRTGRHDLEKSGYDIAPPLFPAAVSIFSSYRQKQLRAPTAGLGVNPQTVLASL